eukprot:1194779-Prorocentrum_minimum.AAC.2
MAAGAADRVCADKLNRGGRQLRARTRAPGPGAPQAVLAAERGAAQRAGGAERALPSAGGARGRVHARRARARDGHGPLLRRGEGLRDSDAPHAGRGAAPPAGGGGGRLQRDHAGGGPRGARGPDRAGGGGGDVHRGVCLPQRRRHSPHHPRHHGAGTPDD